MSTCAGKCITDFGARFDGSNDTQAWRAAFHFLRAQGGGRLLLPPWISITRAPLHPPNDTIIQGCGRDVSRVINRDSDIFVLGTREHDPTDHVPKFNTVRFVSFRDMSIESTGTQSGHIFVLEENNIALSCSWSHLWLKQFNPQKQMFRHVAPRLAVGGFLDCLWDHLFMTHSSAGTHQPTAMVPAFEVSGNHQVFAANTLRNLRCENSNIQPFFKFVCTGEARNNNCVMSQINFEQCIGGMVHWYTAGNWVCEGLTQFDLPNDIMNPTRNHGFFLGRADGGSYTRHMTFTNCDRRGGVLGRNASDDFADIYLQPGGARHVVVINCGERPESKYTVNANNMEVTWVGFGLAGAMMGEGPTLLGRSQAIVMGDGIVEARQFIDRPGREKRPETIVSGRRFG